jgi:hypothetical protein
MFLILPEWMGLADFRRTFARMQIEAAVANEDTQYVDPVRTAISPKNSSKFSPLRRATHG